MGSYVDYGPKITNVITWGSRTVVTNSPRIHRVYVTGGIGGTTTGGAVDSVFGRTGVVVAVAGDYTTDLVTEGTNLYYTDGRVSANTDVAANTAARHTHSNIAVLDALTDAGSGSVITSTERTNLTNHLALVNEHIDWTNAPTQTASLDKILVGNDVDEDVGSGTDYIYFSAGGVSDVPYIGFDHSNTVDVEGSFSINRPVVISAKLTLSGSSAQLATDKGIHVNTLQNEDHTGGSTTFDEIKFTLGRLSTVPAIQFHHGDTGNYGYFHFNRDVSLSVLTSSTGGIAINKPVTIEAGQSLTVNTGASLVVEDDAELQKDVYVNSAGTASQGYVYFGSISDPQAAYILYDMDNDWMTTNVGIEASWFDARWELATLGTVGDPMVRFGDSRGYVYPGETIRNLTWSRANTRFEFDYDLYVDGDFTVTGSMSTHDHSTTAQGGTIDHTDLTTIGTNTHAQIDSHLALTNEHIDWTAASSDFSTSGKVASTWTGTATGSSFFADVNHSVSGTATNTINGFDIDYDVALAASSIYAETIRGIRFRYDITDSGASFNTSTVQIIDGRINANSIKISSTNGMQPMYYEFTNPASDQQFENGFMRVRVNGGTSSGQCIAFYSDATIGGSMDGIGYRGYVVGMASSSGSTIIGVQGYAVKAASASHAAIVSLDGVVTGTGTGTAKDKQMGLRIQTHALIRDGSVVIISGSSSTPNAVTTTHMDFVNNGGELYAEGNTEIDGELFCDGNESHSVSDETSTSVNAGSNTYIMCDATSGNVTVNLPAISALSGNREYFIKKVDSGSNTVTVTANGSDTVEGSASAPALTSQYDYIRVIAGNGTMWFITT